MRELDSCIRQSKTQIGGAFLMIFKINNPSFSEMEKQAPNGAVVYFLTSFSLYTPIEIVIIVKIKHCETNKIYKNFNFKFIS